MENKEKTSETPKKSEATAMTSTSENLNLEQTSSNFLIPENTSMHSVRDKNSSRQKSITIIDDDSKPGSSGTTNRSTIGSSNIEGRKTRRSTVPDSPNITLNLWNVVKHCAGMDLTKVTMPVNFNEPLSMLQRLTEDFEYSHLIDQAAEVTDPCKQLAYIVAFAISGYATTAERIGKPFNPLLGETYECDRMQDMGWRALSEQVSHHPPIMAQHVIGNNWKCWREFSMSSIFRLQYLVVVPSGVTHLEFDSGNHYTWEKVNTIVHNIIIGKLWLHNEGETDFINHQNGSKCHVKFFPYSNTRDKRKVEGSVTNKEGKITWMIKGNWDSKLEIAPVGGPYEVVWEKTPAPVDSNKYYNFNIFASQLNEPEEGVAPTDSRNRPDQRLMEQGMWAESNEMKLKLEERQRIRISSANTQDQTRGSSRKEPNPSTPVWFKRDIDKITGNLVFKYKEEYWECKNNSDWERCPTIFDL